MDDFPAWIFPITFLGALLPGTAYMPISSAYRCDVTSVASNVFQNKSRFA